MSIPIRQYVALLAQYLKPQSLRVVLLAVLLLTGLALQLVNPLIVQHFIDAAGAGAALEQLLWAAGAFLGIALLTQILSVAATYVGETVGWTATNGLRVNLALHCLKLDMPFHKTHTPGEMIERIDGDVTALSRFFSQFVITVLGNILLMVGVVGVLLFQDWRLAVAAGAFLLVTAVVLNGIRNFAVGVMAASGRPVPSYSASSKRGWPVYPTSGPTARALTHCAAYRRLPPNYTARGAGPGAARARCGAS